MNTLSCDKMINLIKSDTSLLMVLNRFGRCLGFGQKKVKEVCADANGLVQMSEIEVSQHKILEDKTYLDVQKFWELVLQNKSREKK